VLFGIPPRRLRLIASATLGVSALAAAITGTYRYRATEITGAIFERPLSNGPSQVVMYQHVSHWYERFDVWLVAALVLALASIVVGVLGRRA
jgi:hypothetical protein